MGRNEEKNEKYEKNILVGLVTQKMDRGQIEKQSQTKNNGCGVRLEEIVTKTNDCQIADVR